jgi:hypothetical protein
MRISALSLLVMLGVPGGVANAERARPSQVSKADAIRDARATADRVAAALDPGEFAITGASHRETAAIRAVVGAPHATSLDPGTRTVPADDLLHATSLEPAHKEPALTASDVFALVAPHGPEIERCYMDAVGESRRGGRLDLRFVIARDGEVLALHAAASTLPARMLRNVETCIRSEVQAVRFPERRNDTTAVVPYVFQRTEAPNSGPQLSCWNPKGCR